MAYRRNSNLRQLASALEKRADFLDDAREWIYDNPELAAGLLGGAVGAGGGALVPTEDGASGRVRNALIGALLGGGLGAGAGYLGSDQIKDLMFGNGEKMRQFDKDMKALTGKKFSGGKEVVDDLTKLNLNDPAKRPEYINDKGEVDLLEPIRRKETEDLNNLFGIDPSQIEAMGEENEEEPSQYSSGSNPETGFNLGTGQYQMPLDWRLSRFGDF